VAGFVAAYVVLFDSRVVDRLFYGLVQWLTTHEMQPTGVAARLLRSLMPIAFEVLGASYVIALVAASGLVPLGFLARTVARARVRAGHRDPLDRVRAWVTAHPRWVRLLTAAPLLLVTIAPLAGWLTYRPYFDANELLVKGATAGIAAVLAAVALSGLARAGVRSLLAPTFTDAEPERDEVAGDEIVFDAVAVTLETRLAVGAVALATVMAVALPFLLRPTPSWVGTVEVGYIVCALAAALTFRQASKIAVGVDGVLVKGTSRTRFFAYREVEDARERGGEIELVRGGRTVLRLQLHGRDATRRDAIIARIREAIQRARSAEDARARELVESSSTYQLERVASGGADYRTASLTRAELWALVEGPGIDADTRTAAAEALARTGGGEERARLRVLAAACAQPKVRVALEELLERDAAEAEGAAGVAVRRLQSP
jgi:hypothetical protein